MKRIFITILAGMIFMLALAAVGCRAQTTVPPIRSGSALPATCSPTSSGNRALFFKTGASSGLYQCLATNTWTIIAGSEARSTLSTTYGNSLATAITAIGATPATLPVTQDTTCSTALTIPATLVLQFENGSKITESGTCTIVFQGNPGLTGHETSPIFSGFETTDITFSGSTNFPRRLSASLWDNAALDAKIKRAIAAVSGKSATIVAYPGEMTSQTLLTAGLSIHFTKGTYTNTIPPLTSDATRAAFVLESNTRISGDGMGQTLIQESSNDHIQIFLASSMSSNPFDGTNENIEISDLSIIGHPNTTVYSAYSAINFGNIRNGHIRRVYFKDTHGFAAYFGGFGSSGYMSEASSLTDCVMDGLQTQQAGCLNCKNFIIARNHFINIAQPTSPSQVVIDIEPNADQDTVENVQVIDNIIDARNGQQTLNGIVVQAAGAAGVVNVRVAGNLILGADDYPTAGLADAVFDAATDRLRIWGHGLSTPTQVEVSTSGSPPAGLAISTTYYIIRVDQEYFKLASSYTNALAGTAIDLTAAAGSGLHNIIPLRKLTNGISIAGGNLVTVENNVVRGAGQACIAVDNSFLVTVRNNVLRTCGGGGNDAISLTSTADSDITGNLITQSPMPISQSDSIIEAESSMVVNTTSGSPTVTRVSGTIAKPFWAGRTVTIDGADYVIKTVGASETLTFTLTTNAASTLASTALATKAFSSNRYNQNRYGTLTLSATSTSVEYSKYGDLRKKGTITIDPASINANTVSTQTFTLTGATVGDSVVVNPPAAGITAGLLVLQSRVSAANTLSVTFQNTTGSSIDEASASWNYLLAR